MMGAGDADYCLKEMLAELIDERIPGSDPPSIIKTYLIEALALPEGRNLLGSFAGPRSGRTVGTALIYRGHSLLGHLDTSISQMRNPSGFSGSAVFANCSPTLRIVMGGSLLRLMWDEGVCLKTPDRLGSVAFLEGLLAPKGLPGFSDWSNSLQDPRQFRKLTDGLRAQDPLCLLQMDSQQRTIASVALAKTALPFLVPHLEKSLDRMPGGPEEKVKWLEKAEASAAKVWVPTLHRLLARWLEPTMEAEMPCAPESLPPRPRV